MRAEENLKPQDLTTESNIIRLVDTFYDKVNQDELLGPVFNDYAQINWEEHLPKMYEFWKTLLLGTMSYKGQPFPKHNVLPIEKAHFERWVSLFTATVDELFKGPKAEEAKNRAQSIATVFQYKMGIIDQHKIY